MKSSEDYYTHIQRFVSVAPSPEYRNRKVVVKTPTDQYVDCIVREIPPELELVARELLTVIVSSLAFMEKIRLYEFEPTLYEIRDKIDYISIRKLKGELGKCGRDAPFLMRQMEQILDSPSPYFVTAAMVRAALASLPAIDFRSVSKTDVAFYRSTFGTLHDDDMASFDGTTLKILEAPEAVDGSEETDRIFWAVLKKFHSIDTTNTFALKPTWESDGWTVSSAGLAHKLPYPFVLDGKELKYVLPERPFQYFLSLDEAYVHNRKILGQYLERFASLEKYPSIIEVPRDLKNPVINKMLLLNEKGITKTGAE
jgi:hypothetical protein